MPPSGNNSRILKAALSKHKIVCTITSSPNLETKLTADLCNEIADLRFVDFNC